MIKRKINLLGEAEVGKTSLILRFVKNVFGDEYLKTIGTNVYSKDLALEDADVKLVIYDIMGDSDFDSVRDVAFEKSTGAIAVVDCTREETLDRLTEEWIPRYKDLAVNYAPIVLAINKVDLEDKEISKENIPDKALPYFDSIFHTSAKTGKNVEKMFKELGFKTVYYQLSVGRSTEQIISEKKKIDSPRKLTAGLLAYASKSGEMPYKLKQEKFEQSGLDRFSLDEEISEEQAVTFGELLFEWYEDDEDRRSASAVKRLLQRYQEDHRTPI